MEAVQAAVQEEVYSVPNAYLAMVTCCRCGLWLARKS
jgi:hypothetical protein